TQIYSLSLHDALPISQRINCNGSFVLVILAPIHQHFADAQTLFHIRDDKIAMIVLQHSRKRMGEWLGDVVTRGCVERNIKLQSLDRKSTRLNSSHVAI